MNEHYCFTHNRAKHFDMNLLLKWWPDSWASTYATWPTLFIYCIHTNIGIVFKG